MFTQYIKNIDALYEEAKKSKHVIYKDFFPIYNIIEKYVKKHKLIVINKEILIGEKKKGLSSYILYGTNIFKHANDMANKLAQHTISVRLYTNIKNEDFTIVVNNSRMLQFYNIHKQVCSIINPVEVSGFLMYPPEFELIDVYHTLYNPNKARDWEKFHQLEIKIYEQLKKRKKILGGGEKKIYPKTVINWLRNKKNCILIDINAIKIIENKEDYKNQFQVIADDVFVQEFTSFIFQFTGRETNIKKYSRIIQTDGMLEKKSIYIKFPKGNLKIMDVWNSTKYELVPYRTIKNIRIAADNVILRFLFLKIWNIRSLKYLKILNKKTFDDILEITLTYIDQIRGNRNPKKMDVSKLSYMGVFIDPIISKQKKALSNDFYPYIPAQYKLKNNFFRSI